MVKRYGISPATDVRPRARRHAYAHTHTMQRRGAAGALATAFMAGLGWVDMGDEAPPIITTVNDGDELLSHWPSETDPTLKPECRFHNGSVIYASDLCSHFVLSRASATPPRVFDRASRCMSEFDSECVLSPELGLSVPAAFHPLGAGRVRMLLAPRVLSRGGGEVRVRVFDPSAIFSSRTVNMNRSLTVEYLDGSTRRLETRRLTGGEAYCVQLLRLAFVPECWQSLDL